jgi:hypothetical protein
VRFLPGLRAVRGRLVSGGTCGEEVHAGAYLRRRQIVLEAALLERPRELTRIFWHEVFHFVWLRAGNGLRLSYETVLAREFDRRARGEMGWSSEMRKRELTPADRSGRSRRWREYCCESFCDSAAWLLGRFRTHEEFTLAPRFRQARREWFRLNVLERRISI